MFDNKYVRLAILTVALAVVIFIALLLIEKSLGMNMPSGTQWFVSFLISGYVVYQFFSQRIA